MATKAVLAREIRKAAGISYNLAARCVDITLETLFTELAKGEDIELRGLGTFYVSARAESNARSRNQARFPPTGVSVSVPAKHYAKRFGTGLSNSICVIFYLKINRMKSA